MSVLRIESVVGPLADDAVTAHLAATLIARSEMMGLLPPDTDTTVLDTPLVLRVLDGMAGHGVGRRTLIGRRTTRPLTHAALRELVARALDATEHSPMPAGEWPRLVERLGDELLAALLGVSATSLRRYSAGSRATPQDVAARLHVLALIVTDLAGAYNDFGIRRWWSRPRPQLDGAAPQDLLTRGWEPDSAQAARLRALAAGLVGAGAA